MKLKNFSLFSRKICIAHQKSDCVAELNFLLLLILFSSLTLRKKSLARKTFYFFLRLRRTRKPIKAKNFLLAFSMEILCTENAKIIHKIKNFSLFIEFIAFKSTLQDRKKQKTFKLFSRKNMKNAIASSNPAR